MIRWSGDSPDQTTPASDLKAKNVDEKRRNEPASVDLTHPAHRIAATSVVRFETRWEEERRLRNIMSGWRAGTPRVCRSEDDRFFTERARTRRELIRLRLSVGFVCHGETIGGRWRPAFQETGLRSKLGHVQRRFVQLTPRAYRLQTGRSKDVVTTSDSKLLALDDPWVVLNPTFRGAFRIDLDMSFPSWDALRYWLEQLPLPCLPNAAVAYECPVTGAIERPHLWYLLPYGSEVWWNRDDPRCRRDIIDLFRGVHAGIVKILLPLGADPGGLANPMRGKNPLSPFWSVRTWNEEVFLDLSTWASWVNTRIDRTLLARESAAAVSGMEKAASNRAFTLFREWVLTALKEWHEEGGAEYQAALADRDFMAKTLFNRLIGRAIKAVEGSARQLKAILYRVVDYASAHWDPARHRSPTRDRGVCAGAVAGKTLRERQAIGGRHAASVVANRVLVVLIDAMRELRKSGERVTKTAVALRSGLSRPTVHKHWLPALGAVEAECKTQCIDKKAAQASAMDGAGMSDSPVGHIPCVDRASGAPGHSATDEVASYRTPLHLVRLCARSVDAQGASGRNDTTRHGGEGQDSEASESSACPGVPRTGHAHRRSRWPGVLDLATWRSGTNARERHTGIPIRCCAPAQQPSSLHEVA
ncbi:hypothetical protein [Microvirga massiliensis]|uniref:hypothetical protein n=1 Tax=Microvirga massiliensis TaxID=1033741 RepID=UPI0007C83158|nr:hypothetical protein [Microvirga massiliensis]